MKLKQQPQQQQPLQQQQQLHQRVEPRQDQTLAGLKHKYLAEMIRK